MTEIDRIRNQLKKLTLHTMASVFEEEADKAAKTETSYIGFLARLVDAECLAKAERSIAAKIAKARFPALKTLESFDFSFQPGLSQARVKQFAELGFLQTATNGLFVGPPGVGKSHLAISIGLKACMARKRVLFTRVSDLMDELVAATVDRSLGARLALLGRLDLLVCDELGYMPMDTERAKLFFQVVSQRYEVGSIILTTNKPFEKWGDVFGDDVFAGAILDRLLHKSEIFAINGPSYRIKDKLKGAEPCTRP